MKKKLLSLLLVIAIMITSVSIGFGAISAFAAPAGKGVEAINAFELTGATVTGATSFNTSITIKSKVNGYKIKVNSVTATIRYSQDEANGLSTVNVDSSVNGAVCDTSGTSFSVSGSIGANLAGLIRYECNYDLLDSNNNVVYAGMTGYGYGFVSANNDQAGKVFGTRYNAPGEMRDGNRFYELDTLYPVYVQVPTLTYYFRLRTQSGSIKDGVTRGVEVISGNAPNTLKTIGTMSWPKTGWTERITDSAVWLSMTEPTSGYYNFTISFNSWNDSWSDQSNITETSTMYYRRDTDKNNAETKYKQYLAEGLEKSYYTTDSWNYYLLILELTAVTAMAIPGDNFTFDRACRYAELAAAGDMLAAAKAALVEVDADYTGVDNAYKTDFATEKNKTVNVTTYTANSTSYGNTTAKLYDAASIKAVDNYYASIDRTLKKCDQKTVDGYKTTIENMTKSLAYADAVYTYLDVAINEYATIDSSIYTPGSWGSYQTAVENARAISRTLKTNSQSGINNALVAIFNAKRALVKRPANFTELNLQISRADEIWAEYNAGKMITVPKADFERVWDGFEDSDGMHYGFEYYYCDVATADKNGDNEYDIYGTKIDEQEKIDELAYNLKEAVDALARFRLLDTTELEKALQFWPEYEKQYYEEDSYDTWSALWDEGTLFSEKAAATYQGDDRKTYENYEEMVRLTDVIINAFESLEKVKADFTALNEAVARIPSDEELALYVDEYVQAIKDIVATIDYGATFDEQTKVDEITDNLNDAIDELKYEHYKSADYSDVEKAIAEARAISPSVVTNYSIVEDAINAVDRTKKIVEQADVDAMAAAIREAIKNLDYVLADYTDVDKAIEEAKAVENKDWYANYYKVEEAIEAVDRTKNHLQQAEVDAMAAAIREAIKNLKLAEADYSGVRDAIALYNAQAPLTDFYSDTVDAVDKAVGNVQYGLMADEQYRVDAWEAEIREAIENMKLLPADYSRLNAAKAYAESFNPAEYSNYQIVTDAIAAVDWTLNCRQNEEMNAQIAAINDAVAQLKLLPADYTKVDEAIDAARYAYKNGAYPYTQESIDAVEDVIASINRDYDIKHQADVDAYIVKIQIAVAQLTYVRADYDALDEVKAKYDNLQRDLYASLSAVDAYVAKIDWNKTIDKQSEVDTYAEELDAMLENLEYAPADYTAVDNAITIYNSINKEYYEDYDIAEVEIIINRVERGLKKNEQDRVNQMAEDINAAVAELRTKMKKADLDALLNAVDQANAKIDEMDATDYDIDIDTLLSLDTLLRRANDYNAETTIDNQKDVDTLTADIIEATENLEFVFTIILDGTGLVIDKDNGYIYGFEEGTTCAKAKDLIKFVGAAEIVIIESDNGFGTGAMIQFISTKDGSVIETYTVLVFGDANGDAVIDMFDVAYIVELVNEGDKPVDMLLRVLDITMDEYLDITDVTIMIGLANMDATLMQDGSMRTY